MTSKALKKMAADIRRRASREHGFRQSAYINFKVDGGYFFCLYFSSNGSVFPNEARLTVKPMYADPLWWRIWDAPEYLEAPLSMRGTGAYALSGMVLADYGNIIDTKNSNESDIKDLYEQVFSRAEYEMTRFISDNPDADTFYPDETKMDYDPDRLLYLMALIHNRRESEALTIIKQARRNKHRCIFRNGWSSDSYTYIKRWCKRGQTWGRIANRIVRKLNSIKSREPLLTSNKDIAEKKDRTLRRKPWYMRLPEWVYVIMTAPIWLPSIMYFLELHDRTIYDTPLWIWFILPALIIASWMWHERKLRFESRNYMLNLSMTATFALVIGILGTFICIGAFDGLNNWFADKTTFTAQGIISTKYRIRGPRGHYRYVTVVSVPEEYRSIKIYYTSIYKLPPNSEVTITYRKGCFGKDIIDNIAY